MLQHALSNHHSRTSFEVTLEIIKITYICLRFRLPLFVHLILFRRKQNDIISIKLCIVNVKLNSKLLVHISTEMLWKIMVRDPSVQDKEAKLDTF
jgi:hypothetical protein